MLKKILSVGSVAVAVVAGSVMNASAAITQLVDYATIATDAEPIMSTAVTAGASIGAAVLVAIACWSFFRRFFKG